MEISNFDGSLVPFFTLIYISIYMLGYSTLFKNWEAKKRQDASSCLISLAHGTPSVILSIYANFLHTQTQKHNFASQNTPFQSLVLDFSISYFLIDTSHYLIFIPNDHLFIAHHVAVLYVFITCRYIVQHGAFAILLLLALAEVTSLLQNTWSLAKCRKDDTTFAANLYSGVTPYFYGVYTIVRGVFGPLFVYRMMMFYLNGGGYGLVPVWAWLSWLLVIVSAILVSILWVSNLWFNFFKEKTKIRKLS